MCPLKVGRCEHTAAHSSAPHGLRVRRGSARAHRHAAARPARGLREWGADVCSAYDGAGFRGTAEVYDELAICDRHLFVDDA